VSGAVEETEAGAAGGGAAVLGAQPERTAAAIMAMYDLWRIPEFAMTVGRALVGEAGVPGCAVSQNWDNRLPG